MFGFFITGYVVNICSMEHLTIMKGQKAIAIIKAR